MTITTLAAETVGNPVANIGIFSLFVVVTMIVVIKASKRNATADEFFTGGRGFSGPQNGIAIAGDYLSAASFLGIAGAIAVYGYDGFLYSIGFLVAWLVALLLVAELLRNTGKFTMADVLSFRLKQRPVRLAAAISTLTVSLFYLLAQMAGAGGLVALLLDVNSRTGQSIVIAVVGILMIVYVLVGGMKGTTWVQIIKAVLLIAGAALMTVMVLGKFGLNFSEILGSAQSAISGATTKGVSSRDVLAPGAQYGGSLTSQINFISLALALVLGTAGLPHVLMRFYTVPTAKEARRSVVWAIALIGAFYLFTLVLGYGAAALVGPDRILGAAGGVNSAAPLLAFELGGVILLGVISAVAFATILAVVAGLTITASASFAHDIYASVLKTHKVSEDEQVRVSRITAVVLGVFAIGLGILANGQNVAFLVALAFAVAAAANLPTILYSLYWKRFNTRGALWSMYGGLISTIVLIVFSPAVSGSKTAMIPGADFDFFPLANPGIVSIPLAFALGIIGTLTSPDTGNAELDAEMEVRSLTGVGAEKAVAH
ncbi:solute symporter family protein [Mycolicibacterium fortuitum]|uniref:SSS sodium solute transporter n=1 Tax=Mycolicibacterium fortuitum subsp. fortuitum DSM 46621 = ATCC 6841 = JCM 6387 TaxID=1214102 RepID=K0V8L7_MYCFO|nr:cation acetate symporter [Mycolicibacterium fortuitum]AIY47858.1 sodium:solute symporter protein [Mycobacterium sp. VKM Ac-1817D]CRL74732.1 SSS sodium solute transporter [Mycolicibacter nonchromogenicus]EJZ11228.1 SSS sodium solute transporter [Mycolicibacterium fortuitum subsp. fortuitum DSM 46621 = ATCC 6841 = JCM 6387]WEV31419.1 cation acetate symporter [Mycolicibacterium fortuitum]CRL58800.1 SSS sodium solute transporter [Mycolicibacterium fortuitum subsp. fortuitum DSM 46621 = ATCC 684